ncbi:MAG: lysylphosphatidylglycerol synthase transmembrane domain-containing protein [Acidimicrobiales bacterium]
MRRIDARKALKRSAGILIFLLVFNNLVLPQLGGARRAIDLLSQVNPLPLVLALGLELSAFVAYTKLTRSTLPRDAPIRSLTLLRIQLATKSVTNLVPGGSAAGGALGFRLLTTAGVAPSAAGFTLATVGLGSAVVLNLMLWLALLVSIPVNGFDPKYGAAALVGFLLLGGFAGLVVLLRHGSQGAERVIRAIARPLPLVNEDAAARVVRQIAGRVGELLDDPALLRRSVGWAVAFWLLDASSLWVFIRAFGSTVGPLELIVAFGLAQVLGAIPITPGGLGVIELALTSALVGFGLNRGTAAIAVTTYRLAAFWLPIPLGAIAYGSLKVGPGSLRRIRQRHPIRTLTEDTADVAGVRKWDVDHSG